jgi:uncharacterized membrane protein
MSATFYHPSIAIAAAGRPLRFGAESVEGEWSVRWSMRRNCSCTPRQMLAFFASLCVVSLGIATLFWVQGATLVMPFAWLELLAVAIALLIFARHVTDRESIHLQSGRLTVERVSGSHVECVEFTSDWVRVEPRTGDRSLIELSGEGQRIVVGRFVRPELRRQLAEEFRWALRRRQGPAA